MRIELCDLCHKRIPNKTPGYLIGRGDYLSTFRLCNLCGKRLEPFVKKIEAAKNKRGSRSA